MNPLTLEMFEELERLGIPGRSGNHRCPECGSSDGLSVSVRKALASCFACGHRYYPTAEHPQHWVVTYITTLYSRCQKELYADNGASMHEYLASRGLSPQDYRLEPIGVVSALDFQKNRDSAKKGFDAAQEKLSAQMKAAGRNGKAIAAITTRMVENEAVWEALERGIETICNCRGWLAFFYCDENRDFISINLRHPEHGFRQVKPLGKGIFSPVIDGVPEKLPGEVLLVEGEFNLLTLRRAFREAGAGAITSAALGSAASWDAEVARKYFEDVEFVVNYDNDEAGLAPVQKLAESGTLWGFAVPTGNMKQNDADYFIKEKGFLAYANEWVRAERFYRSWESCRAVIDELGEGPTRQTQQQGLELVRKLLMERGTIYNTGNIATYLGAETRDLVQVTHGGMAFNSLLHKLGIYPTDRFLPPNAVGKYLGAYALSCAKNTVYLMSYYDREKHVLYVNEYGGYYLRIDGKGQIVRHRNGDDGILFADGAATHCDPLEADLDIAANGLFNPPLNAGEGRIKEYILDRIIYDPDGVGERNAHLILMTAILGLFFPERIPSMPYINLFGPGASMKTSLAVAVGKLIQGRVFRATPSTDDVKELKEMAISLPFIALDEANSIKRLTDILKTIATGGMDFRRELYTTANMRQTPYQARIWMASNTASLTNETISSRMMIIDAGERKEADPYRSEFFLDWNNATRNEIWTELVGRLAAAMLDLQDAKDFGWEDIYVSHRMSSFFVFGMSIAKVRGNDPEVLAAMQAMEARQLGSSLEGNDIVDLVMMLPASYNGKLWPASEWARILPHLVPEANRELKQNVARTGWVAHQFKANWHALTTVCGMAVGKAGKNVKGYAFTKLTVVEAPLELDDATRPEPPSISAPIDISKKASSGQ